MDTKGWIKLVLGLVTAVLVGIFLYPILMNLRTQWTIQTNPYATPTPIVTPATNQPTQQPTQKPAAVIATPSDAGFGTCQVNNWNLNISENGGCQTGPGAKFICNGDINFYPTGLKSVVHDQKDYTSQTVGYDQGNPIQIVSDGNSASCTFYQSETLYLGGFPTMIAQAHGSQKLVYKNGELVS